MLTTDHVQTFHDNGFLHMPQLLAGSELERLRAAADRLQADAIRKLAQPGYLDGVSRESKHWIEHPADHYVYREKSDGTLGFHRIERMYTQDPAFVRAAMHPGLLHHAWQVLERPFWPRGGSLVVKLPHEGAEVRWHQDIPYLYWSTGGHPGKGRPTTHPIPNFTTDIYLDDSTADNGCLWAIPGTHKDGTIDVDKLVAASDTFQLPGAVPLAAKAGDVMFHHVAVIHGSPENYAPSQRRTFYVHYMTNETVQDAYSDWPDLMSPDEAMSFWGTALRERLSEPDAGDYPHFEATPEGIRQV
jgi:phytanoyl-CoA hydroxylase